MSSRLWGTGPFQNNRLRDVNSQWIGLWGRNHMHSISGPQRGGSSTSVRLRERLHPRRVEPADLILDSVYPSGRDRLTVGADLGRQGIVPKAGLPRRRRG